MALASALAQGAHSVPVSPSNSAMSAPSACVPPIGTPPVVGRASSLSLSRSLSVGRSFRASERVGLGARALEDGRGLLSPQVLCVRVEVWLLQSDISLLRSELDDASQRQHVVSTRLNEQLLQLEKVKKALQFQSSTTLRAAKEAQKELRELSAARAVLEQHVKRLEQVPHATHFGRVAARRRVAQVSRKRANAAMRLLQLVHTRRRLTRRLHRITSHIKVISQLHEKKIMRLLNTTLTMDFAPLPVSSVLSQEECDRLDALDLNEDRLNVDEFGHDGASTKNTKTRASNVVHSSDTDHTDLDEEFADNDDTLRGTDSHSKVSGYSEDKEHDWLDADVRESLHTWCLMRRRCRRSEKRLAALLRHKAQLLMAIGDDSVSVHAYTTHSVKPQAHVLAQLAFAAARSGLAHRSDDSLESFSGASLVQWMLHQNVVPDAAAAAALGRLLVLHSLVEPKDNDSFVRRQASLLQQQLQQQQLSQTDPEPSELEQEGRSKPRRSFLDRFRRQKRQHSQQQQSKRERTQPRIFLGDHTSYIFGRAAARHSRVLNRDHPHGSGYNSAPNALLSSSRQSLKRPQLPPALSILLARASLAVASRVTQAQLLLPSSKSAVSGSSASSGNTTLLSASFMHSYDKEDSDSNDQIERNVGETDDRKVDPMARHLAVIIRAVENCEEDAVTEAELDAVTRRWLRALLALPPEMETALIEEEIVQENDAKENTHRENDNNEKNETENDQANEKNDESKDPTHRRIQSLGSPNSKNDSLEHVLEQSPILRRRAASVASNASAEYMLSPRVRRRLLSEASEEVLTCLSDVSLESDTESDIESNHTDDESVYSVISDVDAQNVGAVSRLPMGTPGKAFAVEEIETRQVKKPALSLQQQCAALTSETSLEASEPLGALWRDTVTLLVDLLKGLDRRALNWRNEELEPVLQAVVLQVSRHTGTLHRLLCNCFDSQLQRPGHGASNVRASLQRVLLSLLLKHLHRAMWPLYLRRYAAEDEALSAACRRVANRTVRDYDLPEDYCVDTHLADLPGEDDDEEAARRFAELDPFESAVARFAAFAHNAWGPVVTPPEKLAAVDVMAKNLCECLDNARRLRDGKAGGLFVNADELFVLMMIVVSRVCDPRRRRVLPDSSVSSLHAHVRFCEDFMSEQDRFVTAGYYLTTLRAAQQQLLKEASEQLLQQQADHEDSISTASLSPHSEPLLTEEDEVCGRLSTNSTLMSQSMIRTLDATLSGVVIDSDSEEEDLDVSASASSLRADPTDLA